MKKNILDQRALHLFLLLVILLVATANRFYGLDRLSLWADELWVVMESSRGSLLDMFSFIRDHDNHPPGHYFFTRYWQMFFGDSDYVIRLPFALAGVFLVYSTYHIGKEHYSAEAGLIAAALISSAWQAIYYSQEARANILVAVAALWALNYFYKVAFEDRDNKKNLAGFWLTASTCCYLHYAGTVFVACFFVVFFALWLLRRQGNFILQASKLFFPVALLYSPWLPSMYYHLTHKPPGAWWGVPEWNYFYNNFIWIFWFGGKVFILYQGAFVLLTVCLLLYIINNEKTKLVIARSIGIPENKLWQSIQFSSIVLLMTVMPPVVFFIKSRISQPAYDYRHFIYTMPFMAMAAGFLVSLLFISFRSWARNVILVLVVICIILVQNYSNILGKLYIGPHGKSEYRQTVEVLTQDQMAGTASITIIASSPFFNHYLQRSLAGRTADFILTDSQQLAALHEQIKTQKPAAIYFLETPETRERSMISLLDVELAKNYLPVCRKRFVYAQIIKFSTGNFKQVDLEKIPNCGQGQSGG